MQANRSMRSIVSPIHRSDICGMVWNRSPSVFALPCTAPICSEGLALEGTSDFLYSLRRRTPARRVIIRGIASQPSESWVLQISKNLLGREFGFLCDKKHLIVDRDTRYPIALLRTLEREGIGVIRLAFRSPNMSAYAERFFRPIKDECLSTLVLIGPRMLRRALREFTEHYRPEWNHEEVGNRTTF